jgi:tetratricopeptide (TPR) repeat protein
MTRPANPDPAPPLWHQLACALLAAALCACGTAPREQSRAEREALTANQRAARAFQQGQLEQARALYREALRIDTSIENTEGIAVNLLSLARVEQAAGNVQAAHGFLDRVIEGVPLALPAPRQAEAAARKAQLYLSAREPARAADWAARAEERCGSCGSRAAVINLRALAALEAGDTAAAIEHAQRAGAAAGGEEGRAERASALRIAGEARLARNEPAAALAALGEALVLDQALGLAPRIFRDLMLLGQAAELLGQRDQARTYYERALAVSAAAGDGAAQSQARVRLDRM